MQVHLAPDGGAGIYKDGGDDVDATHGLLICAKITLCPTGALTLSGGDGVGVVTLPGLSQPVGAPAINDVPREMILRTVRAVLGEKQGANITVYVPDGAKAAQRTANPRLGIIGGISILGTTGIVKPMSQEALVASIRLELDTVRAKGCSTVLLTPGNYGECFARETYKVERAVLYSNFLGEAIDYCTVLGFRRCLLVGHIGKLVKLAGGIFQTHSRVADARMEILAAHSALAGAPQTLVAQLMREVTTDGALALLEQAQLLEPVTASLLDKMAQHLTQRGGDIETGIVLFSNPRGILGQTENAARLLDCLREETNKSE